LQVKFSGEGKLFGKKFKFAKRILASHRTPIPSKTLKKGKKTVLFYKISVANPLSKKFLKSEGVCSPCYCDSPDRDFVIPVRL